MDLSLYGIIGHLLNEEEEGNLGGSALDVINDAIDNHKYISLYYDDRKKNKKNKRYYGNPKGFRRVLPYCLGERNGIIYLRGFHRYRTNTKRGPFKWKLFKLDNMKNVRVYKNWPSFTEKDIPPDANPNGDKFFTRIINIVTFFKSPIKREREKTAQIAQGRMKMPSNKSGYIKNDVIGADQKRNVKASTYAKTQPKWAEYERNIERYNDYENPEMRQQKFSDFEKAEAERNMQNQKGPISMNNNDDFNDEFNDLER